MGSTVTKYRWHVFADSQPIVMDTMGRSSLMSDEHSGFVSAPLRRINHRYKHHPCHIPFIRWLTTKSTASKPHGMQSLESYFFLNAPTTILILHDAMEYPDVFHKPTLVFLHLLRSRSRTSPSVSRSSYQFFQSGLRRLQALSRPSIRPAQLLMYNSPTLPTTLVLRDGRIYGSGLNKESRLDAWKSIPTDSESITYGRRMKGTCEGPLSTSVPERQGQRSGSRGHGAGVLIPTFRRSVRHRSCRTRYWRCGKGRCILDGCQTRLRRMRVARREHAATAGRWLEWRVGWVGRTGFFAPWMRPWTALTDISSAVDLLACHPGPVLPAGRIVHA